MNHSLAEKRQQKAEQPGRWRVAADFISRRALASVFDGNQKSAARLNKRMISEVH